ncbi:MAG TPA: hypothetical protein VHO46_00965 [Bacteroidales bacterium]|nr:hypothetical protein [Bacteroidales bacterium]
MRRSIYKEKLKVPPGGFRGRDIGEFSCMYYPQTPCKGLKTLNMRKLIFEEKLKVPPGGFRGGDIDEFSCMCNPQTLCNGL